MHCLKVSVKSSTSYEHDDDDRNVLKGVADDETMEYNSVVEILPPLPFFDAFYLTLL